MARAKIVVVNSNGGGLFQHRAELNVSVAHYARVGRAARAVLALKVFQNFFVVVFVNVHNMIFYSMLGAKFFTFLDVVFLAGAVASLARVLGI